MATLTTLPIRPFFSSPSRIPVRFFQSRRNPPNIFSYFHLLAVGKGFGKIDRRCIRNSPFSVESVEVDSDDLGSSQTIDEGKKPKRYHFLVSNAKFMLDEEDHLKELMFERRRNYEETKKEIDFWFVIEPKFLDQFSTIASVLKQPSVALVSTDDLWITFMKLRLDRVLSGNYEANSIEEALSSSIHAELHFEMPEKWTAPYPKYEFGWWETFLPPSTVKSQIEV